MRSAPRVATPILPLSPAVAARLSGRPFVLLLDIDGTLSPLASSPEQAIVPERTRRILAQLIEKPDVFIVAISGRGVDDARRMLGIDTAWFVGNHGMEFGVPGKPAIVRGDVARHEPAIAAVIAEASEQLGDVPGVIIEDKRWTLSIHYRLVRERQLIPQIAATVEQIAEAHGMRVTHGKEVFEIRPPVEVHKGTAAIELVRHLGALGEEGSVLSIGDDRTDEDMFQSLREHDPRAVTVRVARGSLGVDTAAEFRANDTDAVRELLRSLLTLRARS